MRAGKELGREVADNAVVVPVEVLDGLRGVIVQPIANRQRARAVEVMLRRHLRRAAECVMEVFDEGFFDVLGAQASAGSAGDGLVVDG